MGPRRRPLPSPQRQRGVTIVITLILLIVILLGSLALARMTEVGTLAAGNTQYREAALASSEVGVNTAFAAVRAITDEEANVAGWYSATALANDADGLPNTVDWTLAPETTVGVYSVRYFVDRQCTGTLPIADPARQCLTRSGDPPRSRRAGDEMIDPPTRRQFRITVRVIGPRGTTTFVQATTNRD